MHFEFTTSLWLYSGNAAWVFATVPRDISAQIKEISAHIPKRGFGSVKVKAQLNGIKWDTSIFPDSKTKSYLLPVKKAVRSQASVSPSDICNFTLSLPNLY